jgi:hypothetical protein
MRSFAGWSLEVLGWVLGAFFALQLIGLMADKANGVYAGQDIGGFFLVKPVLVIASAGLILAGRRVRRGSQ